MDDDPKRRVIVNPLAALDVKALKTSNEEAFRDMLAALYRLASEPSPLSIKAPFDICRSSPYLFREGGYRFKQCGKSWRVIVRFLDKDHLVLIGEYEINRDCCFIEVVFVDERDDFTYNVHLRVRAGKV